MFDLMAILTYAAVILVVFILFKIFTWPLKFFFKILINSVIGALALVLINYFGATLLGGFALPVTWWSGLTVGLLGIPGIILLVILTLIL